ncbi:hypothetical protein [Actinomadura rayongensis]|uniref:Uncharacterized protein n=1 Tax=Actinomadura rayongensis TaxID=1429076 RepID=A0A6I4VZR8_9ACTN|nr:hypothetical protein [Actinomadura rayongensis]MXQ63849.1 hypothetical protein [Actinomadura rayongensis]
MRHNHSADPWSAFLAPRRRGEGLASGATGVSRSEPGEPGGPRGEGGESDASGGSRPRPEDPDPAQSRRRVLDQLASGHGPQTFAEICRGTGLRLLDVADAVERLRDDGVVTVEHTGGHTGGPAAADEVVRMVRGRAAG